MHFVGIRSLVCFNACHIAEIEPGLHANNFGHDNKDFDKSSSVSEVYQAERIEESGNVDQGLLEYASLFYINAFRDYMIYLLRFIVSSFAIEV